MDLQIIPSEEREASHGDFGARVAGDRLELPAEVQGVLLRRHLLTAAQLVAYARTDPTQLAYDLGWTEVDIVRARSALMEILRGKVDSRLLDDAPPRRRAFGARAPGT